jgi:hypothetical protein
MKRRSFKLLNILAVTILLLAIYLNFFKKDSDQMFATPEEVSTNTAVTKLQSNTAKSSFNGKVSVEENVENTFQSSSK